MLTLAHQGTSDQRVETCMRPMHAFSAGLMTICSSCVQLARSGMRACLNEFIYIGRVEFIDVREAQERPGSRVRRAKMECLRGRLSVTIKPGTGRRLRLRGIALCCGLFAAPWLCHAQSATATVPDAPASAHAASSDSADLPSAPEPSGEGLQATGAGQNQTNQNPPAQNQQKPQDQTKPGSAPSLGDLGFTPQQTEANAKLQAMLNKRTEMLKIHQRLGVITLIPMAATLITGPMAKAKGKNGQTITEPSNANLDFHAALGGATAGMYFTTASYAIFAPKIPGNKRRGAIRWHEALAFIHGPGMIATPVLGYMAYKQENAGEKVHGIAAAHGAVAWATVAAYGTAIVAVSWPIKLHF